MAEISTIARPYAVAIFNLAKEEKSLSDWSAMLALMSSIVENKDIKLFIQDSKVLDVDREKVLLDICGNQINNSGKNLIKLLVEYKRLLILSEITLVFESLKADDEGAMEAQIIMAEKPDEKMVENLINSLEKRFDKKIEGKVVIDKSIVGGTKIIVGDSVIDASVREQLDNLAYTLKA
ncbi:MAG: F0F1 ATP synthase subunit delta [Methylophilaceae bacterium]|tara:strand:- start:299 stop:835 length:537 start_codon:yes stop_codon:yes gene_type:complete